MVPFQLCCSLTWSKISGLKLINIIFHSLPFNLLLLLRNSFLFGDKLDNRDACVQSKLSECFVHIFVIFLGPSDFLLLLVTFIILLLICSFIHCISRCFIKFLDFTINEYKFINKMHFSINTISPFIQHSLSLTSPNFLKYQNWITFFLSLENSNFFSFCNLNFLMNVLIYFLLMIQKYTLFNSNY